MPRFAANLGYLFTERPLIERFGAAAAAGFKAVELQFPYDVPASAVKAELERHGLTQLGINTVLGRQGESGLAGAARARARLGGVLQAGARLHRRDRRQRDPLHGRALSRPSSARRRRRCSSKSVEAPPRRRAKHNITLLIEPINPRDRPDYFLNRAEHAADIIAKVGAPNVRIQFDFYHAQIVGGDLIRRFEKHFPVVGHVQIAAVPSRAEPDEGEINYPALFEAIDRAGYKGWIGCEYRPRTRTEDGLGWAKPYGLVPKRS